MALRCYPLQPGGLLASGGVIGLTTAESVYEEVVQAFPVILLLIFMVAGIYFLRDLLLYVFTRLILRVRCARHAGADSSAPWRRCCPPSSTRSRSSRWRSRSAPGFYEVYHRVASGKTHAAPQHDAATDEHVQVLHRENLEQFRGFLRSLMMHGAVGTAIGGVMTQVGEPQNLLIAEQAGLEFRRVLPRDGAGLDPGGAGGLRDLLDASSASACSATARRCRTRRAPC